MKRLFTAGIVFFSAISAWAAIEITEPARGATVGQLFPMQAQYVRMNQTEREAYFDGGKKAKELTRDGTGPKPIKIVWTGQTGACTVQVKRLPDGQVFFTGTATGGSVEVDSLEIAREWEISVTGGGETATSTFKTEDQAPRLITMNRKISNARDIGGRIGLDGRRIKQGLVFRMTRLNDNAEYEFYSKDEILQLYKDGTLKDKGRQGKVLAKMLKEGRQLSDSPRHNRLVKKVQAGRPSYMTEKERIAILKRWGFKTDLELRSDIECHGMTGSPLGPEVKWLHVPYAAYNIDSIKERNGKIFKQLLDPAAYPVTVHCSGGADRTGTIIALLEALLGVDEENLWIDYMTTGFRGTIADPRHIKSFTRVVTDLKKYPGETLHAKAEAYFKACGLTDQDIATLRTLLLEPAADAPSGVQTNQWKSGEAASSRFTCGATDPEAAGRRSSIGATDPEAAGRRFSIGATDPEAAGRRFSIGVDRSPGPGFVQVAWSEADGEQWTIEGLADREAGRPMAKDTVFAICSNTKPVTSVLALTLVEEGKLDLDDPVSKYLPEFADIKYKGQPLKRPILLRHLITHLSGLQYSYRDPNLKAAQVSYRDQAAWAVKKGLRSQPGEAYQYCGLGFQVMGAIIEQVTGRKVADLMQERIFDPLGMTETTFYPDDKLLARAAIPYYYPPKGGAPQRYDFSDRWLMPLSDTTHTAGLAGGLFSTVGDYLKFSQMMALKGVGLNGRRILREETFEKYLLTRQTPPGDTKDASFDVHFEKDHQGGSKGGLFATHAQWNWGAKSCLLTFRAKSPYAPKGVSAIDASGFGGGQTRFTVGGTKARDGKVGCMVSNNEDQHGVGTVWLMVNGQKVAEKRVELAIGESKRVIFDNPAKPGDKVEIVLPKDGKTGIQEAAKPVPAVSVKPVDSAATADREVILRDGMGRFLAKAAAGQTVSVAYFGGSITENEGYRNLTTEMLKAAYPQATVKEVPAGIGGSGSDLGVYRLEHDVLRHNPDLIFVEFAMNDHATKPEKIIRQVEGIVRQVWQKNPETDIVFLYTTTATVTERYCQGEIPPSVLAYEKVAEHYGIPSVKFGYRVADEFKAGHLVMTLKESFTWVPKETPQRDAILAEKLAKEGKILYSKDGVHPVMEGSKIFGASMKNFLGRVKGLSPTDHAKRLAAAPIAPNHLVAAKMVPVTKDMLKGEWFKSEKNKVEKFVARLDEIWETKTPGSKLVFSFKGSTCRIYDMQGPDGGQVWVTVDGQRKEKPQLRFDSHCTYHRRSQFLVYDGEPGVHTVEIELDSKQPDRHAVLGRLQVKDPEKELASSKYNGTHFWPAKILIDGEIVECSK